MEKDRYDEGVPSWVELSTSDPAGAADFYGALLGWEAPEGPPEFGGYRNCVLRGKTVAGIVGQAGAAPTAWRTYINVASADDTLAKATAAGATVLFPASDVGPLGRMAVLSDPAGAVFGLWQPGMHTGAQLVNEPGAFCWNELMTRDIEGAAAFYPAVFGWGLNRTPPEGDLTYGEWTVGGASMAGMLPTPPMVPAGMPPVWTVYLTVANCDAACAQIKELGGAVMMDGTDIDVGRFAVAADPQGAMFNVMELRQA